MAAARSEQLDPPGFSLAAAKRPYPEIVHAAPGSGVVARSPEVVAAMQARAFQLAQAQLASVGQTCFFLYMFASGQLSLIGVYMMLTMGTGPARALAGVNAAFAGLDAPGVSLLLPKAAYVAINAAGVAFLAWRLLGSGLLPATSADWLSLLPRRAAAEHAALGLSG